MALLSPWDPRAVGPFDPGFALISSPRLPRPLQFLKFISEPVVTRDRKTTPTPPHKPLQRYQRASKVIKCQEAFLLLMSQRHINSNNKHKTDLEPSLLSFLKGWFLFFFEEFLPKSLWAGKTLLGVFHDPDSHSWEAKEHFNLREGKP